MPKLRSVPVPDALYLCDVLFSFWLRVKSKLMRDRKVCCYSLVHTDILQRIDRHSIGASHVLTR